MPGLSEKQPPPHLCVSAPPPVYARVCVRVYAQYVLLSLHTQTHLPLPSHLYIGSEPRADILLEKVVFSLPHYKSFIAAAVNDWVSGDKTSCSSSISSLHAMACCSASSLLI